MNKQIFLFGFPRSGTTLLRSRISQHSEINLINMPEIIYSLRNAGYNINDQIRITREVIQLIGKIEPCKRHLARLDSNYVESLLKYDEHLSFKSVYEKLLPKPQKVKIWGEKSLNNGFFLKELSQLYPDSLFINIIRDPRSCIFSQYNKNKMSKKPDNHSYIKSQKGFWIKEAMFFAKHAAFWSAWYQTTEKNVSKHIKPNKLINLKYEDFINRPKIHLNNICNRLGISFDEKMIDYDSGQQDPVLLSKTAYAHQNITKKIDRNRSHSYKEMPPSLIWIVERYSGQQMRKFDYSIENPILPVVEKLLLKAVLSKNTKNIKDSVNKKLRARCVDPDAVNLITHR
jgi:hypothetical protein